jgi:guanylate kinase
MNVEMPDDPPATDAEKNNNARNRGKLFVISAPSGGGKSTLIQILLNTFDDLVYSVSHTSREPRKGEREGVDYFFISEEKFLEGIREGRWVEWAYVHDNYYGTASDFIDYHIGRGSDVLLDIDVQGTEKILKTYPDAITVFIMPPDLETLKKRMEKRGADSRETIEKRLKNAKEEIAQKDKYRYIIINDMLSDAANEIVELVSLYKTWKPEKKRNP